MEGIEAFYREGNACVKVDGQFSDSFAVGVGVRQGCVMSPWLFYIFMAGCMREMKAKVGKNRCRPEAEGSGLVSGCLLFVDDTVLLTQSKRQLQRVVDQFHSVCSRRKLRVNAGKRKLMVFDRKELEVVDLGNPYRVSVPGDERAELI